MAVLGAVWLLGCSSSDSKAGASGGGGAGGESSPEPGGGSKATGGSGTGGGSGNTSTTEQGYGFTVDNSLGSSYDIQALWGSSANSIWAVAGGGDLLGGAGQLHHYGGAGWEFFYGMGTPGLLDVAGLDDGEHVFFVGRGTQFYELSATAVTALESSSGGSVVANVGVWAAAANAVWVASLSVSNPLRFWNGQKFADGSAYRSPNSSQASAVWGSSANDVWAADGTGILHFDGQSWQQSYASEVPSPTTLHFSDIHGSGPNDVWAVGPRELMHFDGATWKPQADGMNAALHAVWVAGPNDVWLVGDSGRILHGGVNGFKSVASGITKGLYAIWGSGPHDIWAGGEGGVLIHYGPVDTPTTDPEMPACSPQGYGCSMTPCCSPFRCGRFGSVLVCQ